MNGNNWQKLLIVSHPQLFVRIVRGCPCCPAYPTCPDGWQQVVARVVERISKAAVGYPVRFCEISERCGQLRLHWKADSSLPERVERGIEDAIARAEARAACTCATCGAEGRLHSSSCGRILPLCSEHAQGGSVLTPPGTMNVYLVRGTRTHSLVRQKYDRRIDRFVDVHSMSPSTRGNCA